MVKAREQSKKLNYTDQFKIDHNFNPARWRIFVYKLNVGSSAITRPGLAK